MRMFSKRKGRLKAFVFGAPSAGKTTLFTGLWQISDQDNFPNSVNVEFRSMRDGLINGQPIKGTQLDQVSEWQFILAEEPHLGIELKDYAGEHTRQFLEAESGKVKDMLTECDAVLLLLDSFQICKAKSFKSWADDVKLHTLLRWINEICSDSHRNGMPFIISCTRSDLVPPDRLNSVIKNIRLYTDAHKVDPAIRYITVFDRHKAVDDVPPADAKVPPPEFLVPAKEIKSERVEKLFRDLYQMHKQRRRPDVLGGVLAILGVSLLLLVTGYHFLRPKPLTIDAVVQKFEQISDPTNSADVEASFPVVKTKGHALPLKAVYEHYHNQFHGRADDLKMLDNAFADVLLRTHETMISKLSRFVVQDERWIPQEAWSFLEAYLQFFRGRGEDIPVEAVYTRKKELLDDALSSVDASNIDHLAALARAYGHIGQPLPPRLVNEIRKVGGRDYVVRRIAERLQSAKDYNSVYFCQQEGIPSIKQGMNAYWDHLDDAFKREYEALIRYLDLVRSTKEIVITDFNLYRDGHSINVEKIVINYRGTDHTSRGTVWRVPWTIETSQPISISSEASYGWFRRGWARKDLGWSSNFYSQGFKNAGKDLPYLDYLIFFDAKDYGQQHRGSTFTLQYGSIIPNALFHIPRLLTDANRLVRR